MDGSVDSTDATVPLPPVQRETFHFFLPKALEKAPANHGSEPIEG